MWPGCVCLSQVGDKVETWREEGYAELLPWHQLGQTTPSSMPFCQSEKIGEGYMSFGVVTFMPVKLQGAPLGSCWHG